MNHPRNARQSASVGRPSQHESRLSAVPGSRVLRRLDAWLLSRSVLSYLVLLASLALALRLLWVVLAPGDATSDAACYENLAARLARGMGYVRSATDPVPTAYRPPGYPIFLALLYLVLGVHHWVPGIAQAILGTLSCLLVYRLGARSLGEAPGRIAGIALAIYPNHIYYTSASMSETLSVTLMLATLCLLARGPLLRTRELLAAGLMAGGSALVRPETMLLWLLVIALLLAWGRVPCGAVRALLFTVGLILAILPWTLRNLWVMKAPILICTNTGVNFYIGNHHGASGCYHYPPGNPLLAMDDEVERNREGFRLGLEFMRTHPAEWASLVPKKVALLAAGEVDGVQWGLGNISWPTDRPRAAALGAIATLAYWPVLILGLAGMVKLGLRSYGTVLLSLAPIAWLIIHVVSFSGGRFHFQLIPIFLLFAAAIIHPPKREEVRLPS